MKLVGKVIPHYGAKDGYLVHQVSNDNGVELVCTPLQAAILSVRIPDSRGVLYPILPDYQQNIDSYLSKSITVGGILGPISFPYSEDAVLIKNKRHLLPTAEDKKQFRLMRWQAAVSCTEQSYKITYHSRPTGAVLALSDESAEATVTRRLASSSHVVELEFNQQNQLFIRYSSHSTMSEQFSLGHNLMWNLNNRRGIFAQQMAINASQFTTTPLAQTLALANTTAQDYRQRRKVAAECGGYYRLSGMNAVDAKCYATGAVGDLTTAAILIDPASKRYVQVDTDYPFLRTVLSRHKSRSDCAISLIPCMLLDMPEIFARKSNHTFCCCYQFGTLD